MSVKIQDIRVICTCLLYTSPFLNLCLADGVTFCLGSVFIESGGPLVFIIRLQIFSQGDTGAFGIGNLTVLNDPAL